MPRVPFQCRSAGRTAWEGAPSERKNGSQECLARRRNAATTKAAPAQRRRRGAHRPSPKSPPSPSTDGTREAIAAASAALAGDRVAIGRPPRSPRPARREPHRAWATSMGRAEAEAMLEVARARASPALIAQALNRRALVEIRPDGRRSPSRPPRGAAGGAPRARAPRSEAIALLRLGEAQFRLRENARGARTCTQAAAHCSRRSGLTSATGSRAVGRRRRAQRPGRSAEADRASREALALARRTGDTLRRRQRAQHAHVPRGRHREVHALLRQALADVRGYRATSSAKASSRTTWALSITSSAFTGAHADSCGARAPSIAARVPSGPVSPAPSGCWR